MTNFPYDPLNTIVFDSEYVNGTLYTEYSQPLTVIFSMTGAGGKINSQSLSCRFQGNSETNDFSSRDPYFPFEKDLWRNQIQIITTQSKIKYLYQKTTMQCNENNKARNCK